MSTLVKIAYSIVFVVILIFVLKEKQKDTCKGFVVDVLPNSYNSVLVTKEDIKKVVFDYVSSDIVGKPLKDINIDDVESIVENNPFVKNADVFVDNEDTIHIHVDQNVPIVRFVGKKNDYYLTTTGEKIPLSSHFVPRVLVISGFEDENELVQLDTIDYNSITRLFKISKYIYDSNFLKSMIGQIDINKHNELVLIPKVGNEKILFHESDDYVKKLERIDVYYDYFIPNNGWGAISSIDVSLDKKLTVTRIN